MDKSREGFIIKIRQAVNDRKSAAFEELYQFLVNCYLEADTEMTGKVKGSQFDAMVRSMLLFS